MILKQVIRYDNAVAIEATWIDHEGVTSRSVAYAGNQMDLFRADVAQYGGNIADYVTLIAEIEAAFIPDIEPVKTIAEQAEGVRLALQSAIDDKAKSFGFSGGNALMLYAGFLNPFQPLAQVFATWEASVWVEADAYKSDVIAGTKPMLSPSEAVALMPTYPS
jgi:hypothetical protein